MSQDQSSAAPPSNAIAPKSVWVECGDDPGFLVNCDKSPSLLPTSANKEAEEEKDTTATALVCFPTQHLTRGDYQGIYSKHQPWCCGSPDNFLNTLPHGIYCSFAGINAGNAFCLVGIK